MNILKEKEVESVHTTILFMQSFGRILETYLAKLEQVAITCMISEGSNELWSNISEQCTNKMTEQVVLGRIMLGNVKQQTETLTQIVCEALNSES